MASVNSKIETKDHRNLLFLADLRQRCSPMATAILFVRSSGRGRRLAIAQCLDRWMKRQRRTLVAAGNGRQARRQQWLHSSGVFRDRPALRQSATAALICNRSWLVMPATTSVRYNRDRSLYFRDHSLCFRDRFWL
nr:hypothetical protein Itr_chr06CG04160 [Ipomoea trifida]